MALERMGLNSGHLGTSLLFLVRTIRKPARMHMHMCGFVQKKQMPTMTVVT